MYFLAGPAVSGAERRNSRQGGIALWGGHFERGPAPLMEEINASIGFDKRLYAQDIAGSKAHARMLAAAGILSAAEAEAIVGGLERIQREIEAGEFPFSAALEDIHMNIEARLTDLIGEPGQQAAHGALAQRSGRDRSPALGARRDRPQRRLLGACRRRCWRAPSEHRTR